MLVYFLAAFAAFLCILHIIFKYNGHVRMIRKIPGPKDTFLMGNSFVALVPPVELFLKGRTLADLYDGIYSWWAFFLTAVNLYNPEDIEIVISTMKHSEKSKLYLILEPWLREGLLLSNGQKWKSRRKILTPAFHFNILRQFWPILEENSQRLVEALGETRGELVNIVPVISEYTLNSICETAMGTRLHEETTNAAKSYKNAIYKLGKLCVDRFSRVYLFPNFIFNLSATGRNTRKHLTTVHSFTKRVIRERKEFVEQHGIKFSEASEDDVYVSGRKKKIAMLDLLISAEREGTIDGAGIQEEVDTFMFEGHDTTASGLTYCLMLLANHKIIQGHDTTASGLTYCLMLLANHKIIQDNIVAELREIFGDSTRSATMEDLNMMKYLECCIKESLRLYPPVPFITRTLEETVTLSNYTVPAGTDVNIHIYDLHRREHLFKNALVYDPDRFLPENSAGRHPYAYIPFSAGPRNCIGQRFAMMEMKSCVAALLRRFRLEPVTAPAEIEFTADLVLRNTRPVYVKFVERNTNV